MMQEQTYWDFKIQFYFLTKNVLNCWNIALNLSKEAARALSMLNAELLWYTIIQEQDIFTKIIQKNN